MTAKRRRVGLMGGTFDPIHQGHLDIGAAALAELSLDEVWFMPAGNSYHKSRPKESAEGDDRADLVKAAIAGHPGFVFCDEELNRPGETYSADTLTEFAGRYPDTYFYFLVGSDSLDYMDRWVRPQEIFDRCTVAAAMRLTQTEAEVDEKIKELTGRFGARIVKLHTAVTQVSSTQIRARLHAGEPVDGLLPEPVLALVCERHLYGKMARLTNGEILADLKEKLDPERFAHTLRVAGTAVLMADVFGEDEEKARLAGILHDCRKYGDRKTFVALCEERGIPVREAERAHPSLLHGKLGADAAGRLYGVEDPDILGAVTWHTTGKPDMSLLEKIIFTADYIEPGRTKAGRLPELRRLAFTDLDAAVREILRDTLDYLEAKGRRIDEVTDEAYQWYQQRGAENGQPDKGKDGL